jgi:hypothetical protein
VREKYRDRSEKKTVGLVREKDKGIEERKRQRDMCEKNIELWI